MSRRLARETALQVLFQLDMTKDKNDVPLIVESWGREFAVPQNSIPFAKELVIGTLEHLADIDEKLAPLSDGWPLERMGNVDRNLLRLAAFEIFYRPDIPGRVSLNEAIELAKRFGGEESAKFINGILDRLMVGARKAEPRPELGSGDLPDQERTMEANQPGAVSQPGAVDGD